MIKKFNNFLNEGDKNPMFSHELRINKNYKPKYKAGMISLRFLDNERNYNKNISEVGDFIEADEDTGEIHINYQDIFSKIEKNAIVRNFEKKYNIKRSKYRDDSDDFYIYFDCEVGKETEKLKEIAKDKIVKVVDYVDSRELENSEELNDIGEEIINIADMYSEFSNSDLKVQINKIIKRLQNLDL